MSERTMDKLEEVTAQRDTLLAAAEAAKPYLEDRQLNDFIDIEKTRTALRQAIAACKEGE